MPYCRRCGTPISDYDRYCPKCGTQVLIYTPPHAPPAPTHPPKRLIKDPYVLLAIGLVVLVVVAAVVVAFLFAPFSTWSTGKTMQDNSQNVDTLNLNFQSDIGRINVMTQRIPNDNVLIHVSANGSRSILEGSSAELPVTISFDNRTVGNVLTVNCEVSVKNPLSVQSSVVCDIFVDPDLFLNLNATSSTGQVSFTADKATTIQALTLHASTGEVQANLESNVVVAGDVSLKTNTGAVNYRMSQTIIEGNRTLNLQSNTGSVKMDITQTKTLPGNLKVNATTNTGSINVALNIDNGVGAKIISQTGSLRDINADVRYFSGNKSPLQSNNYPSASTIEINNCVNTLGAVNIQAAYLSELTSA